MWTQERLEEVYRKVQLKSATDREYRELLLKDANQAFEAVAGEKLPEGCKFKAIEQDPSYSATFVIPDFVGEELTPGEADEAAGGISFLLGISACALAIGVGPCAADACGAKGGVGFDGICGGQACGARGNVGP